MGGLRRFAVAGLLVGMTSLSLHSVRAQDAQPKEQAVLILDGVVREVFTSQRKTRTDAIVQLSVTRAELGRNPGGRVRLDVPAPGDLVDIHIQLQGRTLLGGASAIGHKTPPVERSQVRVYLYPRAQGGWQGALPEWYDLTSRELAQASPTDPEAPAAAGDFAQVEAPAAPPTGSAILKQLGVAGTVISPGGDRMAIQVTEVIKNTPAEKAGLEVGDIIVGVNKTALSSLDQFAETVKKEGPDVSLIVFDKNTNKATAVPVKFGTAPVVAERMPAPPPVVAGISPRLGFKADTVVLEGRNVLKVSELTPNGAAMAAGIEVGDVIVGVENRAFESVARLNETVDAARGKIILNVRDVRSGKNVPVDVALGEAGARPAPNAPAPPVGVPGNNRLGVSVEAVEVDGIPTIRVAAVERGSAGERAGLERGDVIETVNDAIIFDADHFAKVVSQADKAVTFVIRDLKSGKKTPVKVELGR